MSIAALIATLEARGADAETILAAVKAVAPALEAAKPERSAAAERQARYRARKAESVTRDVTRSVTGDATPPLDGPSSPQTPLHPLNPPSPSSLRSDGAPPLLTDKDVLWADGLALFVQITGKPDASARRMVGRFVSQASNDCGLVLQAIQAARDQAVGDPVPWITRFIAQRMSPNDRQPSRRDNSKSVIAAIDRWQAARASAGAGRADHDAQGSFIIDGDFTPL